MTKTHLQAISHVSDKVAWLRCRLTISHVSDKVAWLRCILTDVM